VERPRVSAPEPDVDLSRPPAPVAKSWSCPFPPEADRANIDFARSRIAVTVGEDGRPRAVSVLSDPGNGFGRAARRCAMTQSYAFALDPAGRPRTATTAPITVTFTR
jgi:protein TonB